MDPPPILLQMWDSDLQHVNNGNDSRELSMNRITEKIDTVDEYKYLGIILNNKRNIYLNHMRINALIKSDLMYTQ